MGGVIVAAARAAAVESGVEARADLDDLLAELEKGSVWSERETSLAWRGMAQAAAAQRGVPRPTGPGSKLRWQHPAVTG